MRTGASEQRAAAGGPRPTPARSPVTLGLLVVAVVVLSACTLTGPTSDGFERRSTDSYDVLIPDSWETVDDLGRRFQAADPMDDTPMTVRIVVASRRVPDVAVEVRSLRSGIRGLADDARIIDERQRDVPGATGAVQLTSEATLTVAGTGENLRVRLVDLLARGHDGHVVAVKVQGPADGFDEELAATILASVSLLSAAT
jgi:hypothetical protein